MKTIFLAFCLLVVSICAMAQFPAYVHNQWDTNDQSLLPLPADVATLTITTNIAKVEAKNATNALGSAAFYPTNTFALAGGGSGGSGAQLNGTNVWTGTNTFTHLNLSNASTGAIAGMAVLDVNGNVFSNSPPGSAAYRGTNDFAYNRNLLVSGSTLVGEGDSIINGYNAGGLSWYYDLVHSYLTGYTTQVNVSVSGTTAYQATARFAANVAPYAGTNSWLFFAAGVNDIYSGSNAVQTINNISNEWALATTAGFHIVAATISDRLDFTNRAQTENIRAQVNNWIRNQTGSYDFLIDIARLLPVANTNYQSDGVHPSVKTHQLIAAEAYRSFLQPDLKVNLMAEEMFTNLEVSGSVQSWRSMVIGTNNDQLPNSTENSYIGNRLVIRDNGGDHFYPGLIWLQPSRNYAMFIDSAGNLAVANYSPNFTEGFWWDTNCFLHGTFIGNGPDLTNLIHSSTVSSADSSVTITESKKSDGHTNYDLSVSGGGGGGGNVYSNTATAFSSLNLTNQNVTNTVSGSLNVKSNLFAGNLYNLTNAPAAGAVLVSDGSPTNLAFSTAYAKKTDLLTFTNFPAAGGFSVSDGTSTNLYFTTFLTNSTTGAIAPATTNTFVAGQLYTNGNYFSFLVGAARLTGAATGSAQAYINYTNNGFAGALQIETGLLAITNCYPFCIPLGPGATFKINLVMASGASGYVTNTANWRQQ